MAAVTSSGVASSAEEKSFRGDHGEHIVRSCKLPAVAVAIFFGAACEAPDKPAKPERIVVLVRQLGDKEYAKREAATRELDAIGEPARDALTKAAAGDDAEIRERAQK